jgi:hypothetical protein
MLGHFVNNVTYMENIGGSNYIFIILGLGLQVKNINVGNVP